MGEGQKIRLIIISAESLPLF